MMSAEWLNACALLCWCCLVLFPLWQTIRERVLSGKMAFIGSSAGTNAAGQSIHVSICMPIVRPPTFDALGVVPFLVSPHYHDPENKAALHKAGLYVGMEETREQRIAQYFEERDPGGHPLPVVGLREGGLLSVIGNTATLMGLRGARVFSPPEGAPQDFKPGQDISSVVGLKPAAKK
jgi:dipeptidase E